MEPPANASAGDAAERPERTPAERRRHPRLRCMVTTEVLCRRFAWNGAILDHSESGVFVASTAPVIVGDLLDLVFRHPALHLTVQIHGRVVRLVRPGVGRTGVRGFGMQFFEVVSNGERAVEQPGTEQPKHGEVLPSREPRFPWGVEVDCVPLDPYLDLHRCRVENASRSGVYLAGPSPPRQGTRCVVHISADDIRDGLGVMHFQVEVMWRRRDRDGAAAGIGCKITGFPDPSQRHRWARQIARLAEGADSVHR